MKNLKDKKITLATLKSFIKNSTELFVQVKSSFNGMIDGLEWNSDNDLIPVSKDKAIGNAGVYCVGSGRDYFNYIENDNYYGIQVINSCGNSILWTNK
jgi:hypothetical protein